MLVAVQLYLFDPFIASVMVRVSPGTDAGPPPDSQVHTKAGAGLPSADALIWLPGL